MAETLLARIAHGGKPVAWLIIPKKDHSEPYSTTVEPSPAVVEKCEAVIPLGAMNLEWANRMQHICGKKYG